SPVRRGLSPRRVHLVEATLLGSTVRATESPLCSPRGDLDPWHGPSSDRSQNAPAGASSGRLIGEQVSDLSSEAKRFRVVYGLPTPLLIVVGGRPFAGMTTSNRRRCCVP